MPTRLRSDPDLASENLRWLWQGFVLALELWDDKSAYDLSRHHLQMARRTGALSELPLALGSRTPILVFCGELTAAASLVEESRSVHEAAAIAEAPYGALVLTAWRGQSREGTELIDTAVGDASARGEGVGVAICEYSHAVLCNGLGQHEEVLAAARRACADPTEMVAHNWGMIELIEAAARTGRTDLATEALERLTTKAQAYGTDWALGIQARSQALLSEGDIAEHGFDPVDRRDRVAALRPGGQGAGQGGRPVVVVDEGDARGQHPGPGALLGWYGRACHWHTGQRTLGESPLSQPAT